MKKYIISIVCTIFFALPAFAQNVVKGTVQDAKGEIIPGAMVLNSDNGKWATSDLDGNFTVEVAKGQNLQISCMGYSTASVVYQGEANLTVTLSDDTLELEETVVIGYGSVKKKDLTGAVGIMNAASIEQQSVTNLSQSLQGAIPGLQVSRSSSMPGASASLQIRGVTSINGSSPLILVDGMAVNSIDNVATEDVEQITVLKDAASASIYGARAAAGVILITTKGAKEGDLHINYNGEYSMIGATQWADYLTDPVNYMTMFNEYKWNENGNGTNEYPEYEKDLIENYYNNNAYDPILYANFDWKNAIVKKFASRHKHSLGLSYGNKVVKTRVSASYEDTDALYKGSDYQRMMARMRNTIKITKKLTADVDFSFKHAVKTNTQTTPLQAANMYPNIYLGLYPDGRVAPGKTGSNTLGVIREGGYTNSRNDYITGKISLTYKPVEGLDITGSFTPTFNISKGKDWSRKIPYYDAYDTDILQGYVNGHNTNELTESRSDANSYEIQVVANYEKQFANAHNLNAMAGYEEYYYFHESTTTTSKDMPISDFPYLDLANKDNVTTTGDAYENAYRSFFGRIMYNYKSRYYVQANVRTDGSSRFAKGYKWGVFPSVSLGWVISNESFMANVTPVSYLKLRGSIGTLGNERIGNYPWQPSVSFNNAIMFGQESMTAQTTAAQVAVAVQDITWETTWTYDLGFDVSFLRNRLSLSGDYFYKKTKDMLLDVQIPEFTGFNSPTMNVADMHTNGWELKIDWHDNVGDFTYGVGFNVSDATSVMGNMGGKVSIGKTNITREGEEYQAWYGYKCLGIIQNADELKNVAKQLVPIAPGDLAYADVSGANGEPDGMISADYDKVILGSSQAHFIFGGYLNLGWKGLSLGVMFNGVGKQLSRAYVNMIHPFAGQWLSPSANLLNKDGSRNYWSLYNTDEQNAKARYPRLSYTTADSNNYGKDEDNAILSDYWLMDGSFLRIKNINLSYAIPSKALSKAKIQGLKVYFNIDDPICFDHYLKGWDPEQGTNSYIARTFTLGVDIKF